MLKTTKKCFNQLSGAGSTQKLVEINNKGGWGVDEWPNWQLAPAVPPVKSVDS